MVCVFANSAVREQSQYVERHLCMYLLWYKYVVLFVRAGCADKRTDRYTKVPNAFQLTLWREKNGVCVSETIDQNQFTFGAALKSSSFLLVVCVCVQVRLYVQ